MNKDKMKDNLVKRVEESGLFTNHFGSFNKTDYVRVIFYTIIQHGI